MTGRGPFSADYPFEPHFMDVGGANMHYIDEGESGEDGVTFLLLHGNSTWSYQYRNIIPHLLPLGRCVAPDLIGHGKSDKPDIDYRYLTHYGYVEKFIDQLGLKNIVLVLHDWGGGIGLNYAMSHESNIRGIALWETFVRTFESWDDWPQDLVEGFKAFRDKDTGWDLIVNKNVFMEEVLPYGIHRKLSKEEMDAYLEPHADPKNRKMLYVWPQELPIEGEPADNAKVIDDYVAKLGQSQVPKILFWAKPGAIVPEETVRLCEERFPNLESVFLGESGHYIAEDYPHEIGEKIVDWVKGFG
jgi:haloalkane dehalogenase